MMIQKYDYPTLPNKGFAEILALVIKLFYLLLKHEIDETTALHILHNAVCRSLLGGHTE